MPFQAGDVVVCTNTEINSDFNPTQKFSRDSRRACVIAL